MDLVRKLFKKYKDEERKQIDQHIKSLLVDDEE